MLQFIGYLAVIYLHYHVSKRCGLNVAVWVVAAALLPVLSTPLLVYFALKARKYSKWPTVEQYIARHPQSAGGRGIYCCVCGSDHIKSWGIDSPNDVRRLHSCGACNTSLYRTGF